MDILRVDCNECVARGPGCSDCVISVLLGEPADRSASGVELADDEQAALAALADSGLLPPLRLIRSVPTPEPESLPWIAGRFAE